MKINNTPDFLYDVRLVERHLAAGKVNRKDVDAFLRTLPDAQDKLEIIPLEALFDLDENEEEEKEKGGRK
jgi:hypothetical protein